MRLADGVIARNVHGHWAPRGSRLRRPASSRTGSEPSAALLNVATRCRQTAQEAPAAKQQQQRTPEKPPTENGDHKAATVAATGRTAPQ